MYTMEKPCNAISHAKLFQNTKTLIDSNLKINVFVLATACFLPAVQKLILIRIASDVKVFVCCLSWLCARWM